MLDEEDDGVTIGSPDGVGRRMRAHYRSGAEELARLLALGARGADVSQAADAS